MTTQLQQLTSDMATVKTLVEQQAACNEKILKILEGNGQPGLIQRTAMVERDTTELSKNLEKAIGEITRVSGVVNTLNDTVSIHCREGNPEHETLVVMFRRKPGQFVLATITIFLALTVGVTSGFFEHVITYLKAFIH